MRVQKTHDAGQLAARARVGADGTAGPRAPGERLQDRAGPGAAAPPPELPASPRGAPGAPPRHQHHRSRADARGTCDHVGREEMKDERREIKWLVSDEGPVVTIGQPRAGRTPASSGHDRSASCWASPSRNVLRRRGHGSAGGRWGGGLRAALPGGRRGDLAARGRGLGRISDATCHAL